MQIYQNSSLQQCREKSMTHEYIGPSQQHGDCEIKWRFHDPGNMVQWLNISVGTQNSLHKLLATFTYCVPKVWVFLLLSSKDCYLVGVSLCLPFPCSGSEPATLCGEKWFWVNLHPVALTQLFLPLPALRHSCCFFDKMSLPED